MSRDELERLSKAELIDLVLRLQRPEKTSRTSSKPPATDRKEKRENAKPGGAKPGHEGHSRTLSEEPDRVVDHRPEACPACGAVLAADLPAETVGVHEHVELPVIKPVVEHHRRLSVRCPRCGRTVVAPAVQGTPFGPRLHAAGPCCTGRRAASRPAGTPRWRRCAGPRSSPRTRPGCASRARPPIIGCSAARRPSSIRWRRPAPPAWSMP